MGMLYALDLETDTKDGDGLNPTNPLTRITSAAVFFGHDRDAVGVDAEKARGAEGAFVFDDPSEARLLRSLNEWLLDATTVPGLIVTWNGAHFDIPFLLTRATFCGVPLGLDAQVHPAREAKYPPLTGHLGGYVAAWGPHDHADIMHAFREEAHAAGIRAGLKPVARHYGMAPIEVDRADMEKLSVAERSAYNLSDVEVTYRLALQVADLTPWRDSTVATPIPV